MSVIEIFKMKNTFYKILLAVLVMSPVMSIAQDCYYTEKFCPHAKREGFVYNLQSRSGAFIQGDTATVTFIVYKDMEYRLSVCSPSHYDLDGQFQFKVIENTTKADWIEKENAAGEKVKKRVFKTVPIVRYDNSKDENIPDFVFHSDKTRKLVVKVYVPVLEQEGEGLGADSYACVGLLLEHKPGTITGFKK